MRYKLEKDTDAVIQETVDVEQKMTYTEVLGSLSLAKDGCRIPSTPLLHPRQDDATTIGLSIGRTGVENDLI